LIQDALAMGPKHAWRPPIVMTSAAKEEGIDAVWDAVLAHRRHLEESGALAVRRQQRLKQEVVAIVAERAREEARQALDGDSPISRRLAENQNGKLNPYDLAEELLRERGRKGGS
jgi:LAO/AO transport system kinase